MSLFISILFAYLLGSIPFGLILTKMAGGGDIRKIGSGNIGATNVLRTGKKWLAALTLLLDAGKGALAVLLIAHFDSSSMQFAGLAALLGHLFPIWLRFKGGKGVATSAGIVLAIAWPVGLIAIALWAFMAAVFRYSSLAALVSVGTAPLFALDFGYIDLIWMMITIAALIFIKHAGNIHRLLNGTEPKIGQKDNHAHPPA